jgi:hypothetical protein
MPAPGKHILLLLLPRSSDFWGQLRVSFWHFAGNYSKSLAQCQPCRRVWIRTDPRCVAAQICTYLFFWGDKKGWW